MRIVDNQLGLVRSPEMAADRAAALRQTGLSTGTLQEINKDTDEDMHSVRDRPEVEGATVRTDAESESGAGQEGSKKEREEESEQDGQEELRRRASERLLNLPVSSGKDAENEAGRFDMRV